MALTKITGQVINDTTGLVVGVTTVGGGLSATDGFFSGIVTAVGNASFSGNVSVGGTLTYEDVTNIDAVGLVTARNGIVVGSGITLSKDGDIFATGITTISENLKVGTGVTISPDGDGFYTGVVTATSYAGDGSGLTGIAATDNVRTGILDVAGVGTFRNDVNIPDKIIHLGDTNTTIRFPADDTITSETGGSERLRIDSSGNINFGAEKSVALPSGTGIQVYHSANPRIKLVNDTTGNGATDGTQIYLSSDGDTIIDNKDSEDIIIHSNASEKFKVSSTGSKTTGYHQQTAPIGFCAYRLDTGTDDEYPLKNSSGNSVNTSYFGASAIQTPRGQLTTHTEYNNNGSGGSCYNHDGTKFTAPIAGVYTLTYNLSLYVVNDTGGDNSVGWGFLKNQTKLNWNTYDSGLSISQSTPYVIGANSGDTLTNAFEIGAPHLTIITTLAANDEIQVGWDNMSKILGVRSFIFSGHLLG